MTKKTKKLQTHPIRAIVLRSIIFELIKNSYKPTKFSQGIDEELKKSIKIKSDKMNSPITIGEYSQSPFSIGSQHQKKNLSRLPSLPQLPDLPHSTSQFRAPRYPQQKPSYSPPPLNTIPMGGKIQLGKIAPILMDPSVFSIEVPGEGKNVLVNRAGTIQTSNITLSRNEIDQIMNHISDTTQIPLITGLFKAAVQDLIVTAVVSEFVGTRFMIQKRMPFQRR